MSMVYSPSGRLRGILNPADARDTNGTRWVSFMLDCGQSKDEGELAVVRKVENH